MIANCPSCGTHYKHEPPTTSVRARCGRCDASVDLARLSPYRIVSAAAPASGSAACAASALAVELDHPALAVTPARSGAESIPAMPSVRPPDIWEDDDPLPEIPENAVLEPSAGRASGLETEGAGAPEASLPAGEGAATFALWLATGAIAGTGASWTMGGATITGMAAGVALGAVAGWGWLRWTSRQ